MFELNIGFLVFLFCQKRSSKQSGKWSLSIHKCSSPSQIIVSCGLPYVLVPLTLEWRVLVLCSSTVRLAVRCLESHKNKKGCLVTKGVYQGSPLFIDAQQGRLKLQKWLKDHIMRAKMCILLNW